MAVVGNEAEVKQELAKKRVRCLRVLGSVGIIVITISCSCSNCVSDGKQTEAETKAANYYHY